MEMHILILRGAKRERLALFDCFEMSAIQSPALLADMVSAMGRTNLVLWAAAGGH
jgi:hypothetical protein